MNKNILRSFLFSLVFISGQALALPPLPTRTPESKGSIVQVPKGDFRTPARRYGAAYTIKLALKRGMTEYVATMWVKPDQAESTLDYNQMKELGWSEPLNANKPYLDFDDASVVGVPIEKTRFKNGKSEWAYVPDFPRACCYGVIGRDILSQYQIKFVPKNPTHMVWTKVSADPKAKKTSPIAQSLQGLFSFQTDQGTFQKKKHDLSEEAYTLDLNQGKVEFEAAPISNEEKTFFPRTQPLFTFYFVPPIRKVKIENISSTVARSASKVGLKPGMLITELNGKKVFLLDQFEVQAYLKGKSTARLTLTVDQLHHPVVFDFKKGEFQETQ